jgi:hypothetical protein
MVASLSSRNVAFVALVIACGATTACSKREPAKIIVKASPEPAVKDGEFNANDKHGSRRLMGLDVPVFVDGDQRGVMRAGDMAPLPEARAWNSAKGILLSDYLASIGVDVDAVRSIHLHANGDKIGGVEGNELRADKKRFVVSFLDGE